MGESGNELEQRLGLLLRGVQRMADELGAIEQRLPDLASAERVQALAERVDEYRVKSRAEVGQLVEALTALGNAVAVVLREQQELAESVRNAPPPTPSDSGAVERLTVAVRGLRDDLAQAFEQLRSETAAAVDRVAGEQAERAVRLHDAVREAGERTVAALGQDDAAATVLAELAADLVQLRTTLDGRQVVLTEAIASIRDDLAAALAGVRADLAAIPPPPAPPPPADDSAVRSALAEIRDDLRRLQGEMLDGAGQLRTDLGARQAELREEVLSAVRAELATMSLPPVDDSAVRAAIAEVRNDVARGIEAVATALAGLAVLAPPPDDATVHAAIAEVRAELGTAIEAVRAQLEAVPAPIAPDDSALRSAIAEVRAELGTAIEAVRAQLEPVTAPPAPPAAADEAELLQRLTAIEAGVAALRREVTGELGQVAQRDDLRRGVDRVLGAVNGAEQAVTSELRAVDARVGAMADDVRLVRALRDGLDALSDGIDGVRQLAARSATSHQMTEITAELSAVLHEIESARSQVLRVEQSTTPVAADVVAVGDEVDDLGRRIDQLAEVIEERITSAPRKEGAAAEQVAARLRQVSESARQLGNGVLEELRSRRSRRPYR